MPSFVRGRIVFSKRALPDPQGENPKQGRPFVLLSSESGLIKSVYVFIVAISDMDKAPDETSVPLAFGPQSLSRLEKPSAAICNWMFRIKTDDLESATVRTVEPDEHDRIWELAKKLRSCRDAETGELLN